MTTTEATITNSHQFLRTRVPALLTTSAAKREAPSSRHSSSSLLGIRDDSAVPCCNVLPLSSTGLNGDHAHLRLGETCRTVAAGPRAIRQSCTWFENLSLFTCPSVPTHQLAPAHQPHRWQRRTTRGLLLPRGQRPSCGGCPVVSHVVSTKDSQSGSACAPARPSAAAAQMAASHNSRAAGSALWRLSCLLCEPCRLH